MASEATKVCGKCRRALNHNEFHRNASKRDGRHGYCKSCQKADVKRHQAKHGKHILNRAYRYRLTVDEVHAFLQVPCCQSCGRLFQDSAQHFDHCHENRHVRGVICAACNWACAGPADQAVCRLRSCVEYLQRDLERVSEQG